MYQPPQAFPQLWAMWSSPQVDKNGTTGLTTSAGQAVTNGLRWSANIPVMDTQGSRIQSAFTPSLAVLANQLHLVVVKPDGRGTLAHYVYVDNVGAWEYNASWAAQPLTTASPSLANFSTSGLLYLAFTTNGAVSVCTYTPSTTPGRKFGTWSAPTATGVPSADAPALFTSPRRTGPELHLAATALNTFIKEYAMGSSLAQWAQSAQQPGGATKRGVGACSTPTEAILAVPGADVTPTLYYTVWTEDGNTWPGGGWVDAPSLVLSYGNAAPVVFNRLLCCFYVVSSSSGYNLVYVTQQLYGK